MAILSELGSAVKRQRLAMGLTQERLAELSNLSRATINELETGKISNLSLTRAEHLANVLGFGLGVTGVRRSKDEDALAVASRTASVSFSQPIPPETLRQSLLRGFISPDFIPHLRALLDEAPIGVLSAVAAQLERENDVRAKATWQKMRQLANALGCTRPLWS